LLPTDPNLSKCLEALENKFGALSETVNKLYGGDTVVIHRS